MSYRQSRLLIPALVLVVAFSAALVAVPGSVRAQAENPAQAANPEPAVVNPQVTLHTSMGDIRLELFQEQAPKTVENFLQYARDGHYDGTVFHRVISHFMIQGGGFTAQLQQKETREPIPNEATNGLKNIRGTVAMARTGDPNSATAQFFINVEANPALDHTGTADSRSWGYAVFGGVLSGMEVVDEIRFVKTGRVAGMSDVPMEPVVIESVEIH